jgi:hypothetical protein
MRKRLAEKWHANHDLYEAYFWVLMTVPAWFWWKESIFYVLVVSHYANYKTAVGTHQGRRARMNTEGNDG